MKDVFLVLSPGPYTTVQDKGRFDFQHMGVPISGALDPFAHSVANWLVGNDADCATLEITFMGTRIEVLSDADVAVTGADMNLTVNGAPMRQWRSIRVRKGDVVKLGQARSGCRAYLAVTGGVDVPLVMGSRSTYVSGHLGGMAGRPLKAGDVVGRIEGEPLSRPRRLPWFPRYAPEITLRVIAGPQDDCFGENIELLFESSFKVSSQADRMGCRLQGPPIPRLQGAAASIVSEPILPGNVQVPADGKPIILLVEQTIGGYAKIATVISPDIHKVAQAKPEDTVRFIGVSIEKAHGFYREWMKYLAEIRALLFSGR